jgi:hypothetical protein
VIAKDARFSSGETAQRENDPHAQEERESAGTTIDRLAARARRRVRGESGTMSPRPDAWMDVCGAAMGFGVA